MQMRFALLTCATGVFLCSAAVLGNQAASVGTMADALRAHVRGEEFAIVTSIRGLPLGVRDELQALWGTGTLDIAEPGAEFQAGEPTANAGLPTRRLIAAGCAPDNHCLVYYERGGRTRTYLVALFHWTPARTRFEWGGTAPGGLKTIEEVRKAVLSGAIKSPTGLW
jgi:hypothetical protein